MQLSIIVAGYNEGDAQLKTVQSCIETCGGLDCEVIIADDASCDGSVQEVERRFPGMKIVRHTERQGPSPTKDRGARAASGEILVFLDGHCKPERGSLQRLVEDVQATRGQALITPTIVPLDTLNWRNAAESPGHGYRMDLQEFEVAWLPLSDLRVVQEGSRKLYHSPAAIGCAFAITRQLYETLWGFDPDMRAWGVEDLDFSLKCWLMGYPIMHDPDPVIGHRFQKSFDNYSVPPEELLANRLRMARKNFTHATWEAWVADCRSKNSQSLEDHPEGLWTRAWQIFESRRDSVEQERAYLMSRRVRDEIWYASRFGLEWPQLEQTGTSTLVRASSATVAPSPSPSPPPSPDRRSGPCSPMNSSGCPVRYFNGEVVLTSQDIVATGYGFPWGHVRTYSNQQKVDFDRGNGWNWNPVNLPRFSSSTLGGAALMLNADMYNLRYFGRDSTGNYVSQFGDLSTLVKDPAAQHLILTEVDGSVLVFNDMTHLDRPGGFVSLTAPGGTSIDVTSTSGSQILELQRSLVVDGTTITDSFLYNYFGSGPNSGQIQSVAYRRRTGAGAWQNINRATYTYYVPGDANGSQNDLKTATRQIWVSDSASWADLGTDYYRYYVTGASTGSAHTVKFFCGPQAFANLIANTADPFTASDATVGLYADNYFEYDLNDRVVLERANAGSLTMTFSYARNPRHPSPPSGSTTTPGPNVWIYKTIMTNPDSSQVITYANYAGQTMLSVTVETATTSASTVNQWCTYFRYNEQGQIVVTASPSAITGYDDSFDDLLLYQPLTNTYQYLRDHDGKLDLTSYYPQNSVPTGSNAAPPGYLHKQLVQQGQLATPILLRSVEYTSQAAVTTTVFPVSRDIMYRHDTGPSNPIVTSYEYTFYTDTTQVQQKTTILPRIAASQNGSGTSNQTREFNDRFGYLTWSMNERGFISRFVYDEPTGGLLQRIDDVDTSIVSGAPAGWTTPAGGGLNLVSDFEVDNRGRTTQGLGPAATIDVAGAAISLRRAVWIVYDDPNQTVRVGQGFAVGTGPSYTYTLINPVQIRITDLDGKLLQEIQATRAATTGKLLPSDTFAQSAYTRWQTYQYTDCCLLESKRVYRLIPSSSSGSSGTNYDETGFGYDVMKRRNQVTTPGGTISFTLFDVRSQRVQLSIGTNNSGGSSNNMVVVAEYEYDGGQPGGDGNLTRLTQQVNATTNRVTQFQYDWRNRVVVTDGEIDYCERRTYDNLDRLIQIEQFDTSTSGHLIGRQTTSYDDLSRVYQTRNDEVDPHTGTIGNSLTDNTWYDAAGNVAKSLPAGSKLWTKTSYDGLNRPTISYQGYGVDASYSDIFSVTGDVVMEQTELVYDDASNVIQTTQRSRYNTAPASQTGALQDPGHNPKARVTYLASYPDPLGRPQAVANSGTNGGTPLSRSATIPAPSDTVLVSTMAYDSAGNLAQTVDPAGMISQFVYDDAGRRTSLIENKTGSSSSSSSSSSTAGCSPSADTNRTTNLTYTPDGLVGTVQAVNSSTSNQTTTYHYGTALSDSEIASSLLLRSVTYPGSVGGSDQVWVSYNRQGQRIRLKDQNGSEHSYEYDLLGRLTEDCVTTLGTGIDGMVRRIGKGYEVRGMVNRVTSFDSPTVGSGSVRNEVTWTYNGFRQSVQTFQSPSGAVNPSSTASVQMGYANGSANTIRPTSLTYPNGRIVTSGYGTSGSITDSSSQIASLIDSDGTSTHLTDYSYLGLASVVEQDSTEAHLRFTLLSLTGSNDPDTGDIYSGLDRFGRLTDVRWRNTSTNTDLSRVQYGYNRASSRTWRSNPTAPSNNYDWLYGYDGLQRVTSGTRGTLNGTKTGITSPQFGQCWTLDSTGNWQGFKQDDTGGGMWNLEQTRSANPVNEITALDSSVGESWATPQYDPAGNMTTIPRPGLPRPSWANLTVAEWSNLTSDQWAQMEVAPKFQGTYDAWNRLVKLTDGGTGQTTEEYQYDGRNYRTVVQSYSAGTLSQTRHAYYTDHWQCVEERLGTSPDTSNPDRQFVWGIRYIDDLVCRDRSISAATLNERLYGCQDANWNMTAVVDTSGAVQERYEYDPYGHCTFLSPTFTPRAASSDGWETLYAGYRFDATSGLYSVRNRYYHQRLGTWLTREPYGFQGTDTYGYVGGLPVSLVDPFGEFGILMTGLIGAAVGDVIGAVAGGVGAYMQGGSILRGAAYGGARGAVAGGVAGLTLGAINPGLTALGASAGVSVLGGSATGAGAVTGAIAGAATASGIAGATGELAVQAGENLIGTRDGLNYSQIGAATAFGFVAGGTVAGGTVAIGGRQALLGGANPTLYSYGDKPFNPLRGGFAAQSGRTWMTSEPQGKWLTNPGFFAGCLRLLRTGRYRPYPANYTTFTTNGVAPGAFGMSAVTPTGAVSAAKTAGGQYATGVGTSGFQLAPGAPTSGAIPITTQPLASSPLQIVQSVGGLALEHAVEGIPIRTGIGIMSPETFAPPSVVGCNRNQ
ncbi:MAG: glycosyltransferase [Planctomycetota bacterium]